jgi:CMP-N-acetylneuraminic acid synthetase
MINQKKILAVITARAGSKRLPNKNILELSGKPLIAWTIEASKNSKYIDKLIVSTDSQQIAEISKQYGAKVPFMRPQELANDNADSISVLKHSIEFFKSEYNYILLLQPTSPLRTTQDIDSAIEMLNEKTKSVISVCETEHSPLWSNTLPENLSMTNFIKPEVKNKRSQDLPKFYRLNGAVYIAEINYFYKNNGFIGNKTKAYIMSQQNSVDIDTELDFKLCEIIYNKKSSEDEVQTTN